LKDGTFEKTERFGKLVAAAADKALAAARPLALTPFRVKHRAIYLPVDNKVGSCIQNGGLTTQTLTEA
jgi:hypothetical protein